MNKEELKSQVDLGMSQPKLANYFKVSQSTVRYYLSKYDLKTRPEINFRISDEQILEVANNSDSFNQVCLELTGRTNGNSYYHLKKRLINLGFDFGKFVYGGKNGGGKKTAVILNNQALLRAPKDRVRRQTLNKHLQLNNIEEKCANCELTEWKGEKLKLHIHHKDQNRKNNNLDNLEYLCPNCHSIKH